MSEPTSLEFVESPGWGARIGRRIVCWRAERAWNQEVLADAAGVSRTTLCQLERGQIARPRMATLERIAAVFGQPVRELIGGPAVVDRERIELPLIEAERRAVDRATNPAVVEVAQTEPGLFAGWTGSDWDRLYGTFGVGGALSEEGVRRSAEEINRGKETTRKLLVLLETHFGETVTSVIEALYQQVIVVPPRPLAVQPVPGSTGRNSLPRTSSSGKVD